MCKALPSALDAWRSCVDDLRTIQAPLRPPSRRNIVTLTIGGCAIELIFHSQDLRALVLPAFSHVLSDDVPALTLHLHDFDSAPIGLQKAMLLAPPVEGDAVRLLDSPVLTCFAQARGRVVSVIDWDRNEAYWIVRSPADLSYIERSSPLRSLLTHWLGRRGRYLVHAAAVGDSRGSALILGHGGAGKSTTALACLEHGLDYVADDYCLVERDFEPLVSSLYSTGKLDEHQVQHFPVLSVTSETEGRPHEEKVVLYLSRSAALSIKTQLPLRTILLAHITGRRDTTVRRLAPAHAFRAIAPSCALHFPLARADALACFGFLVKNLPAYVLELGTNYGSIPAAIRALLASRSSEQ